MCRVQAWLHELNRQGQAQQVLEQGQDPQYAFTPQVAAEYMQAAVRSGFMDRLAEGGPARHAHPGWGLSVRQCRPSTASLCCGSCVLEKHCLARIQADLTNLELMQGSAS